MANSLSFQGDTWHFKGVAVAPEDPLFLALEVAKAWKEGGISENLLKLHGLPAGEESPYIASKEYVERFFAQISHGVDLLAASGVLRNSPKLLALGFGSDSKRPQADFIDLAGDLDTVFNATPHIGFNGAEFYQYIETNHCLDAWAYAGLYALSLTNGANHYGVCESPSCGRVYQAYTKKSQYCRDSCRVRAAQIRKGL